MACTQPTPRPLVQVFVPSKIDSSARITTINDSFPMRIAQLAATLTIGWPLYLLFNVSGRKYERWANHFDPFSPIFSKRERIEVLVSDAGLLAMCAALYATSAYMGWAWLLRMYGIPYLIVNFWLVMITLLQHTHPALAHYDTEEWDWLRGALSTVDRSYGLLDRVFHHIADTHVAHHLFSQLPHYHAVEATRHLKAALGKYYQRDSRNVFVALWQDWFACSYIAADKPGDKVYWFVS
jgi:omega-6 fatty acid desaturase / acyl-lipid omega-6 desaturase (Delta-12 desaturase)